MSDMINSAAPFATPSEFPKSFRDTAEIARITDIVIPSAARTVDGASPEKKPSVFRLQARELMGYVRKGIVEKVGIVDALQEIANSNGLIDAHGQDEIQRIMSNAAEPSDGNAVSGGPWWRDPVTIPPRQFLFGRHYIRGAIGATVAAGGRGKTTLSVFEAVTMAAGFDPATREPLPGGPLRVWLLNGEEDQDELDRRIAAVCQRYGIFEADLGGRLFAQSVRDNPMRVAVMKGNAAVIDDAMIRQMIEFIERNKIDVFMIDPLVSFHDVPENDNPAMDKVVKQGFGAVAGKTDAAGEVFHHPGKPKPGQADTVVEDGRGASAILWAVRSARVLNFMAPAEAEKLGISDDERKVHIRITNGKANMAPLGKAKWMKIEVENLPNGDQVACGSSWTPPNPFEGLTVTDLELAQKLARTGAYRDDSRSPEWFGYALAEQLGLSVSFKGENDLKDLARLKSIIKTWKQNKVLDIDHREDEHRKAKAFIVLGTAATAGGMARYSNDDEAVLQ